MKISIVFGKEEFLTFCWKSVYNARKTEAMTMAKMKEIQLDDNDTGLKVFVIGEPDLSLIPESLIDCFSETIIAVINRKTDDAI